MTTIDSEYQQEGERVKDLGSGFKKMNYYSCFRYREFVKLIIIISQKVECGAELRSPPLIYSDAR
jgi:hypothetical protein